MHALPEDLRSEAIEVLIGLQHEPTGPETEPLEKHRNYRKVYLSRGYRIIYTVSEPHRQVFIDRIRSHDEAYKGFGD